MRQVKSTVEQIRARFDNEVERFSNLETGQSATMDAPLVLDLIAQAAKAVTPRAQSILDIGCGAGNYTLRLLRELPDMHCTLVDLSAPMLERARQRVSAATAGQVVTMQGDMRELGLKQGAHDVIVAAAALHHLRETSEWQAMFAKLFAALRPGGSLWISDLVTHENPALNELMRQQWSDYLVDLRDQIYRDHVFAYIAQEDTPRPLEYQMRLMQSVGFHSVTVLHKRACFAAFGGVRA